jgi:transposase
MDMDRDSGFMGRLEVVETGRRRRWSVVEKIRIVEESLAGRRRASATARRHDLPNSLLFKWRKAYREGGLGGSAAPAFVRARIIGAEDEAVGLPPNPLPRGGRMEIVLAADRRIIVGADVDGLALGRVLDVLERR